MRIFKKNKKIIAVTFVCVFAILILAYFYLPQAEIVIKHVVARVIQLGYYAYNPDTRDFKFYYQDPDDHKLGQLATLYNLSRFKTDPDFSGLLALKDWLRQRYSHGSPPRDTTFYNFDSLQVLRNTHEKQTLDCGIFSYIYVQCVLSIDGQARIVLLHDKIREGHVVSEIWSNRWSKWIVVDVDHNLYYERGSKPLNALELHDALINKNYNDINIIRGPPLTKNNQDQRLESELSKYYHFAIRMRNDFFNKYPRWHYKTNLYLNCVQWIDKETPRLLNYIHATNKKEDLYWDIESNGYEAAKD